MTEYKHLINNIILSTRKENTLSIHLQWFAAEDEGRTEQATEQKIKKAREEGRVAKSTELINSISLLFTIISLAILGNYIFNNSTNTLQYYFQLANYPDIVNNSNFLLMKIIKSFFIISSPIMIVGLFAGVLGNIIQTGFLFTTKPLEPDFKKIIPNITRWLKRSFGWPEGIYNLFKSLFKTFIIVVLAIYIINSDLTKFISFHSNGNLKEIVQIISFTAFKIMIFTAIILLGISIIDYIFQRKQHLESLKMTKEEVKEELKQLEGDPQVRNRIRNRMKELLGTNLNQTIPKADVIITNPTHYAVALQWDNFSMIAPMITAKGSDENAFRIRKIAKENDIPIMENKPLARSLYDGVEIGEIIPEQYWEVVSRILAEVYRLKEKNL